MLNIASAPGKYEVYLVDSSGILHLVDVESDTPPLTFPRSKPEELDWARIYPSDNGEHVAVIDSEGSLLIWSTKGRKLVFEQQLKRDLWAVGAWDKTSDRIALGTLNGEIHIIPLSNEESRTVFKAHQSQINALAWHPVGNRIGSICVDEKDLRIWDANLGQLVLVLDDLTGLPTQLAWDPEGRKLAATSKKGELFIWDATAGLLLGGSG